MSRVAAVSLSLFCTLSLGSVTSQSRELLAKSSAWSAPYKSPQTRSNIPIYRDFESQSSSFYPTGFMGDYSDISYNAAYRKNPYSGKSCIQIVYKNKASKRLGWAGMYWQSPAYNWGNMEKGRKDLSGVTKLVFWARGEKGGERIESFKVGGIKGRYRDSCEVMIGPLNLKAEWQKYEIDLRGQDLTSLSGGFAWTMKLERNPRGAIFYLDEVYYTAS